MGKAVKTIVGVAMIIGGLATGNLGLVLQGAMVVGSSLTQPKGKMRQASATTVQLGEVPRQALFGRAATAGSLVDAFNYGGKYGTDWEVLVLDLADHRCDALEGFYVNDQYVAFTGDGAVAGFNGQLNVWWRPGTEDQTVPSVLTSFGPGWTANDNGAGVCHVTVAYKADDPEAKEPTWPGGRPRFLWVLRGARCYDSRADSSVGGSGAQRWNAPTTWAWSDNPIVCRYTWARGLYACDRVTDPAQLLVGRGLSAIEAPPANVFHRANLCDETVGGAARYRVGGMVASSSAFIETEQEFAAACAGTIVQPEGSVEIDPGEARAAVVTITDDDLLVGSKVVWNNRMLGAASAEWINTVVARYVEPALKWADHAAPVRRDVADILADRSPREERVQLGYVTDAAQAGRIAEIRRRMGRLAGRAEITLPPRFAALEEGDWIVWHSPRRFGATAFTFRIEAWGSDAGWRHQLSLRQISASVYSDVAPLDDGSVAVSQPAPPPIGAPAVGSWTLAAGYQSGGDLKTPVLVVTGASDDPAARFVRIEYCQTVAAPTSATVWNDVGVTGPDVQRREIPVASGGTYWVAVSYVVGGVTGDRRVLGPAVAGKLLYADGTPVQDVQQIAIDALEMATGKTDWFYQAEPPTAADSKEGDRWVTPSGRVYRRIDGPLPIGLTGISIGGVDVEIHWVESPESVQIAAAMVEAAAARGEVLTRISSFRTNDGGVTPPTARQIGDYWSDKAAGFTKRWNGAVWEISSDVTAKVVPTMTPIADVVLAVNSDGSVASAQLPRRAFTSRMRGAIDQSDLAAWSLTGVPGDVIATIENTTTGLHPRGTVTIAAPFDRESVVIQVVSTLEELTLATPLTIRKGTAPPASGGGGGGGGGEPGAPAYVSDFSALGGVMTYVPLHVAPLSVVVGSSGEVALAASLRFGIADSTADDRVGMIGKFRLSEDGGTTWTDVDGGVLSQSEAYSYFDFDGFPKRYVEELGYLYFAYSATGLTPDDTVQFRVEGRKAYGDADINGIVGTAQATPS